MLLHECLHDVNIFLFIGSQKSLEDSYHKASSFHCPVFLFSNSNAVSERSFSGFRQLQTYLRTSICQRRLNDLWFLHVHNEITDSLDEREIVKQFISFHSHRSARIKLWFLSVLSQIWFDWVSRNRNNLLT